MHEFTCAIRESLPMYLPQSTSAVHLGLASQQNSLLMHRLLRLGLQRSNYCSARIQAWLKRTCLMVLPANFSLSSWVYVQWIVPPAAWISVG